MEKKSPKRPRKLSLSIESIQRLTGASLAQVAGHGHAATYDCGSSGNPRCTCPV